MIGDAGKRSKNRNGLDLQLSKKYETNLTLGNFFCNCLLKLGFEAHRIKDNRNKYRWITQSSPFFKWAYNVLLGLNDNETTTFHQVKMNWILTSPKYISKRFLQGVFESDGSVLYDSKITCAVDPNVELIQRILKKFNIRSHVVNDKGWKRIGIESFNQIKRAHNILFASEIQTKRYRLLSKIVNAKRAESGKGRIPEHIKDKIRELSNTFKSYQIIKIILEKDNFHLSRDAVKYYKNKKEVKKWQLKKNTQKMCKN